MKERPILFSGPMVRALLAGTKTQTRRVVKPQPDRVCPVLHLPRVRNKSGDGFDVQLSPYGQPGDRLWVRETWAGPLVPAGQWEESDSPAEFERPEFCRYAADGGPAPEFLDADEIMRQRWTPSIHMPRWASRITLEITAVRVERLQDISEADATAEGIERGVGFPGWYRGPLPGDGAGLEQAGRDFKIPTACPRLAYHALWDSINGPGSWDANPWVWVVEFSRVTP